MDERTKKAVDAIDAGALADIFSNREGRVQAPVLQCVQIKPIENKDTGIVDRYRLVLSDSKNYVPTMLGSTLNHHVDNGHLRRGTFLRLTKYQANNVNGKKILIVVDIAPVVELGDLEKIGNPKALEVGAEEEGQYPTTITSNNFYGDKPQEQQQKQRSMPSHAKAPASSASHANIYPIEALSPYTHKWTIKARCTAKSEIKTWHNRNGEGKLFNVNLLDESGEIRATAFNDQVDQYYDMFQEGHVYYISSPCRVQMAKKQFSNLSNDYELSFERETQVEKAEEQSDVPQVRFNFTTIEDLKSVDKDTTVDVVGILKEVGETSQITSKTTSKPYDKRELTLADNTGYSVRLTIWGKTASSFDVPPESVVAFKGVKVSDFGGRSLSLLSSGTMTVDPDIAEAHNLRGWYDGKGRNKDFATHANVTSTVSATNRDNQTKTIAQIKEQGLGMSEQPDFFSVKGAIQYIKQDNFCYPACMSEGCNRKVIETDEGVWRCERCDKNHPRPEYRYIMSVSISDHTGQIWLSCFDPTGRAIMGKPADELMALKESDEKALTDAFSDANCQIWNWRVKAKMDNYQEQQRVRYQVSSSSPLDFVAESNKLIQLIKQYDME